MTIDPVIVGILLATVAVIVSVYYWNRQLSEQESLASYELQAAAAETKLELFEAQYNMHLFDTLTFPFADEYAKIIAVKPHNDIAVHQIIMRRAIDCVVKAHVIQQHGNQLGVLIQQQQAPPGTEERIKAAITKIEQEIAIIQAEANKCKDGWGKVIVQQAADLSINLEAKKQMAARQRIAELEAQQQKQQQQAASTTTPTSAANANASIQPATATTTTSAVNTPQKPTPQKLTAQQAFANAISTTPTTTAASAGKHDANEEKTPSTPTTPSSKPSTPTKSASGHKKSRKSKHAT